MVVPRVSLLVLSEDSGGDAIATIESLTREMLKLALPGYRRKTVEFTASTDPHVRQALAGQLWRSRNPKDYQKKIALLREIASKLAAGVQHFVLCHFDGDQAWSARQPGKTSVSRSVNQAKH